MQDGKYIKFLRSKANGLAIALTLGLAMSAPLAGCSKGQTTAAASVPSTPSESAETPPMLSGHDGDVFPRPASLHCISSTGPQPDISGVRIGMSPDQAATALFCALSDSRLSVNRTDVAAIQAYHVRESGRPILGVKIGTPQSGVSVTFLGNEGHEKVISVEKHTLYQDQKMVLIKDIDEALRDKYGSPSETGDDQAMNRIYYRWITDSKGISVDKSDPEFAVCKKFDDYSLYATSTNCGNVIFAYADRSKIDPKAADGFHVIMVNHSEALDIVKTINGQHDAASAKVSGKPSL